MKPSRPWSVPSRAAPATAVIALAACSFSGHATVDGASDDTPDAAAPDAGAPAAPCASPGTAVDTFDDPARSPVWFTSGAGSIDQGSGTLAVTPPASVYDYFTGYVSAQMLDLTGAATEVEVVQMLDTTQLGIASLSVVRDSTHLASIGQQQGQLFAYLEDGAAPVSMTLPYDPVAHRFWRIAERAAQVHWEASPDGVTWTEVFAAPSPRWIGWVRLAVGGGNHDLVPAPGTVIYDNVDTLVPRAGWCKAATLVDDFGTDPLAPAWYTGASNAACNAYQLSGTARSDQTGGGACRSGFSTSRLYDLTASQIALQPSGAIATQPAGWSAFIRAVDPTGKYVGWEVAAGQLCAVNSAGLHQCRPYDGGTDAYLVLGAVGGQVDWRTGSSPTNTAQMHRAAAPTGMALDAVRVEFGSETTVPLGFFVALGITAYNE